MAKVFDPTVSKNSNYPHIGPTSTKVREIPAAFPIDPGVRTFVYETPDYVYKVQPEDTLASVAKKLYGVNSKFWRDHLRRNGFETGAEIRVNGVRGEHNGQ